MVTLPGASMMRKTGKNGAYPGVFTASAMSGQRLEEPSLLLSGRWPPMMIASLSPELCFEHDRKFSDAKAFSHNFGGLVTDGYYPPLA
jgi:hypothetical protein